MLAIIAKAGFGQTLPITTGKTEHYDATKYSMSFSQAMNIVSRCVFPSSFTPSSSSHFYMVLIVAVRCDAAIYCCGQQCRGPSRSPSAGPRG
jgi:hypothetical protein